MREIVKESTLLGNVLDALQREDAYNCIRQRKQEKALKN
jgi:hypothetical protein